MRRFLLALGVLLVLFGGGYALGSLLDKEEAPADSEVSVDEEVVTEEGDKLYALFTINTHDFLLADYSSESLNRVVDIHEEYGVPVDVYLTDPVVQAYMDEAPELMERFKTSDMVAVSYHHRPPTPYHMDFKPEMLDGLSEEEAYEFFLDFEEHALDWETGEPSDEPGGFEYLKQVMGYAPPVVSPLMHGGTAEYRSILYDILKEKGAQFVVKHGVASDLGSKQGSLYVRPEHVEVKIYEEPERDAGEVIEEGIAAYEGRDPDQFFVNIKLHEDDFYVESPPWELVYFIRGNRRNAGSAPFYPDDFDEEDFSFWPDETRDNMWRIYEEAVAYVANNPQRFEAINMFDVADML